MTRQEFEELEDRILAPYALRSGQTRGRAHQEQEHPFRLCFQRDRDRIVHSSAFRRLEYKTQVFVNHEGDYYRTRLTHTMEASQIARTVARALRLNEHLAEAVALVHDLGHPPFGHAGERMLNELMRDHGGFEHNAQSLRIVDLLERRYADFDGLNLTFEVREGIVKHSPPYDGPLAASFEPGEAPNLEVQIVSYADEIAYNSHDIDDGLQSQMLDPGEVERVSLWREVTTAVQRRYPHADPNVSRYQAIRLLIDRMVSDLLGTVSAGLESEKIRSPDAVRRLRRPLAGYSAEMSPRVVELKTFLMEKLYTHNRVIRMTRKAQGVMRRLFETYVDEPRQLPAHILDRTAQGETVPRVVADYIAGMTDRFAVEEYTRLFDPSERV